jgi:hypothetical protein
VRQRNENDETRPRLLPADAPGADGDSSQPWARSWAGDGVLDAETLVQRYEEAWSSSFIDHGRHFAPLHAGTSPFDGLNPGSSTNGANVGVHSWAHVRPRLLARPHRRPPHRPSASRQRMRPTVSSHCLRWIQLMSIEPALPCHPPPGSCREAISQSLSPDRLAHQRRHVRIPLRSSQMSGERSRRRRLPCRVDFS